LIVDEGWQVARAAERYDVSWPTAKRWADRYRHAGPVGMADRSSRPHHSPRRTPQPVVRRIVHLRWRQRLGPVQIADRVGAAPSTVHAVLTRCRLNRLSHLDRHTGEPVRRYEHDRPGALLHVDVKKLGNIPDGGGWRFVGRAQGDRHRAATPGKPRNRHHNPKMGTAFVHTVSGDHSRIAYAEIHDDETAATATAVLRRAVGWFPARGVAVERVLSDNGACYRARAWRATCAELGITPKFTRPYRPQTNGKIERFHRTLAQGWPSGGSTSLRRTAARPYRAGSTSTTTTGPTPPSEDTHPSPA
jgi:transposase InsO family protein